MYDVIRDVVIWDDADCYPMIQGIPTEDLKMKFNPNPDPKAESNASIAFRPNLIGVLKLYGHLYGYMVSYPFILTFIHSYGHLSIYSSRAPL